MSEDYEKVKYVAMIKEEETRPLSWAEWIFGRAEEEVPADPQSKRQKYLVTEQIKQSKLTHKLVQKDVPFHHTQSVVNTFPQMEDTHNALPSPYKPLIPQKSILKNRPTFPQTPKAPKRVLHPSIVQQRKNLIKDDITI